MVSNHSNVASYTPHQIILLFAGHKPKKFAVIVRCQCHINLSYKRYNARSFPFYRSRFLCSRAAIHLCRTSLGQLAMLPISLCNGLPDWVCGFAEHENIQMLPSDIVSGVALFHRFSWAHLPVANVVILPSHRSNNKNVSLLPGYNLPCHLSEIAFRMLDTHRLECVQAHLLHLLHCKHHTF